MMVRIEVEFSQMNPKEGEPSFEQVVMCKEFVHRL
jgi:hypothetical protein